uniref:Uncharacterized protein n=1 Tax=Romanomermis culicivorax TaxID=13658 RepID=A0A915L1F3_ROMCU
MDFGDVNLFLNRNLRDSLLEYASQNKPGRIFTFRKKKSHVLQNGDHNEHWTCLGCESIKKAQLREGGPIDQNELFCTIIVTNGCISRNPELGHNVACNGYVFGRVKAKQLN